MIILGFLLGLTVLWLFAFQIAKFFLRSDDNIAYILLSTILFFSLGWGIFYIEFLFNVSNLHLLFLFLIILMVFFFNNIKQKIVIKVIDIFIIVLILLVILKIGNIDIYTGFNSWDSVVSWNRWAIELYNNIYNPYNAAYPILFPAIWSLFYKLMGTSDIWWLMNFTLLIIPFILLFVLIKLYMLSKNIFFIIVSLLIYPYLISKDTMSGYMDMPVMLFGLFSLITLYYYDNTKKFEYLYFAFLFAGLAFLTKQAGILYIVFCIIYALLNNIEKKKIVIFSFASFMYFISYSIIYYQSQNSIIGNFNELNQLTNYYSLNNKDLLKSLLIKFTSFPENLSWNNIYLIVISYILMLILFFIKKDYHKSLIDNIRGIGFLSGFFFIVSIVIWVLFFSYDYRNSLVSIPFLIVFISILIEKIYTMFSKNISSSFLLNIQKLNFLKYSLVMPFYIVIFSFIFLCSYYFNDRFLVKVQDNFQLNIGSKDIAEKMNNILKNRHDCLEIYTNRQIDVFNRKIDSKDRLFIHFGGWSSKKILANYMNHSCKEGRYLIFGYWELDPNEPQADYQNILKLENDGKIISIGDRKDLIYFIPPQKESLIDK